MRKSSSLEVISTYQETNEGSKIGSKGWIMARKYGSDATVSISKSQKEDEKVRRMEATRWWISLDQSDMKLEG